MDKTIISCTLYDYISELEIVDCHEHLIPEADAAAAKADFSDLFGHYSRRDFLSAGMTEKETERFYDKNTPLGEKWKLFSRFYPLVEDTGYIRSARIVLKKRYGVDRLTEDNYRAVPEAVQKNRYAGFYRDIFRENRIRYVLNNIDNNDVPRGCFFYPSDDILKTVTRTPVAPEAGDFAQSGNFWSGVKTLCDLHERAAAFVENIRRIDGRAIKVMNPYPYLDYSAGDPASALKRMLAGRPEESDGVLLFWYTLDQILDEAVKADLPVSVHTGYWGDYREQSPEKYISLVMKHPRNRFDLFHLGYPYVKSTLLLAKTMPNVCIDLCWTYVISPHMAGDAIRQIIDLIPLNKVMGFGGDYRVCEKIYGHRELMTQTMSRALADKVDDGTISLERAKVWAKAMLWDNPVSFYNL